ncbi:uncharacterized protein prob1 [Mugil cephalus]|uniref:uncharacterized protein prob1 n=1 Tax=Mugil cephalus TaxID=48193 RepID=UPI001FB7A2A3|nr:uncharacterized protein prob1 [Mugil cephalus]
MNSRLDRGGRGAGGRKVFLSAHRCPEVDLLPGHNSETRIVPDEKSSEFTGACEADYLDICFSREEDDHDEESVSDWSDEDLSLHFSPSVILQSDDEDSDPESGFQCVDVTMETQEGEGLKMVPKRQIQLKKKKESENVIDLVNAEKLKVTLKDGSAEGRGDNSDNSANELLCSTARLRPDLLLRQHSMPSSFHTLSPASGDVEGNLVGGNSRRLQKSLSLDETKTKMASCIIKNILSKKMQVEQNISKTSHLKKPDEVLPVLPQPAELQRGGGGGGTGVVKAPVHLVRDMRSLVKNTYSLSFSNSIRPTSFTVTDHEVSPPPTYKQAVGVKGHVAKVAASFDQSQHKKQSNTFVGPVRQRACPPPLSNDLSQINQSESTVASLATSVFIPPPPPPPPPQPQSTLCAQEQSPSLGASSQSAPGLSHQVLHPYFFTPTALSSFHPTLLPHLGTISYISGPLSYIQTQLQPSPPAPSLPLMNRSEENSNRLTGKLSEHPNRTRTAGAQERRGSTEAPVMQRQQQQHQKQLQQPQLQQQQSQHQHHHQQQQQQQLQQQPFWWSFPGLIPAQVGGDVLVDITGAAAAPRVSPGLGLGWSSMSAPSHLQLDSKRGRCLYVDTPPQPRQKLLLDPETGQFIPVFLPAASSASSSVLPVRCANPTPAMVQVGGTNPTPLWSRWGVLTPPPLCSRWEVLTPPSSQ